MKLLFHILKSLGYTVLFLLIIIISILAYVATTSSGLNTSIAIARYFLPGKLTVSHMKGRLINHLRADQLHYTSDNLDIDLRQVDLHWQPFALFHHQLIVNKLTVANAAIVLKPSATVPEPTTITNPFPALPVDVLIEQAAIGDVTLTNNNMTTHLSKLYLRAQLTNQQWQINQLDGNYLDHQVHLQGQLQPILPYGVTANLSIEPLTGLKNALAGTVNLGGNFFRYHWQGRTTRPLRLTLTGDLAYGKELHTTLTWHKLTWPLTNNMPLTSNKGEAHIDGTLHDLRLNLNANLSSPIASTLSINAATNAAGTHANALLTSTMGEVNATVGYNDAKKPAIQGTLAIKTGNHNPIAPITNITSDSQFRGDDINHLAIYSETRARYLNQPVKLTARYEQQLLTALLDIGANHVDISGSPAFPWRLTANLANPALLHPALKGLQTTITATANVTSMHKGSVNLKVGKGKMATADLPNLLFDGGGLQANLDTKQLQATGQFTLDPNKKMTFNLALPKFRLGALNPKQTVKATANLSVNSLSFLNSLTTSVSKVDGQLTAVLNATGTLQKPLIDGELHLDKTHFLVPQLHIAVNPVQLSLKSRDQKWQATGSLTSAGKTIALAGNGDFYPTAKGLITINGDNVLLMNSSQYIINVSPNISVEFAPSLLKLRGNILIPKALIKPQTFTETVSRSGDIKFVGDKKPPPNPMNVDMDMKIAMGNDVKLAVKGLQGSLVGGVELHQYPGGPITAVGELNVQDGKYQAYGQDLIIDEGQLVFTGGLIDDPGIRIRAVRKFNNATNSFAGSNQLFDFNSSNMQTLDFGNKTTVGIEVVGRLSAPKVQLFSVPANLSQADILSMLLLGKPASQANQAGGQLLMTAVSALKLDSTDGKTQLLDQLKQNLGIDFNLENNTQYNQKTNQSTDNTSFVVGKSLSKRLYLSYNIGLTQADTNTLTLKYLLNKFFSIQVNASSAGSGIDFLYTHEKD